MVCLDRVGAHLQPISICRSGSSACGVHESTILELRNVLLDETDGPREVTLFDQPTNVRLDVRPRLPIKKIQHVSSVDRLLDFDLPRVAVMRENRPSIPGPQPCSLCCFRSEGIQHTLVDLAVRG